MVDGRPVPGIGGDQYLPYEQRTGNESIVYFTRELSAVGLREACSRVAGDITGKVAVKVHTGEEHGPNIIPPAWVRELLAHDLPGATIVETNTYYEGSRGTTEQHRRALRVNGWDFAPVDILDERGTALLPVTGGTWFREMSVGVDLLNYDSLLALTHFKGHALGGFGGALSTAREEAYSLEISRGTPWAVSAGPTRTSASDAPTGASARRGSTRRSARTTSGASARRSSWSA